mmetsp:Transcript_51626/g.85626  ORF Transcript_51626/g.85626 Transcript_51626/m.85626 type:complete len:177 (+) Transcript_51626:2-532(+)
MPLLFLLAASFAPHRRAASSHRRTSAFTNELHPPYTIELQKDCGRGQEHLSARLVEGDVCVYQMGTWMVDWTPVGPGSPPRLLLARVDCLQINWTTDCEHGRVIGTAINSLDGDTLHIDESEEFAGIEFGPEQLVARVPAEWTGDHLGTLLAPLPCKLPAMLTEPEMLQVETQPRP